MAVPSKPYDIVNEIVQNSRDEDLVAYGTHNDALIKTEKTQALQIIYAQKHDADFWSHYTVLQMRANFAAQQYGNNSGDALNEYCFINFKFGSDTEYRLFCGNVNDYKSEYPTVTIRKPAQTYTSESDY